ncbi:uncharacterized protein LOC130516141 isoform X1 [Takifugu flavidus]|uniref:uncharacterized protein LOC130516141 isoform X1 n=1 Tax=Takifugu flavidus TaxID=433684 RepID=UPI0025443184|nr:uncharacterized protein LOC130516141 isoform X1 [Takifugu flavidus]XP_056872939.1 uncharacterized protein LOC130516141 isoform X1 [Takifugu flavidus]XP_056872940.1 uncharacterized protein LOC130516141 isoform X1 [Takifugu flavidus]XP_056872942.1 uncharacterized protein LOC130516141 isoform X1 [Takifugu flavidus]
MTKKLLATQELQMKRLKTVIDDLQTQLEKVKFENRTLKQAQGRLQQSKITENKFEELKAQYTKDTRAWQEQHRNYRRQLRAAEKTIKDNNLIFLKEQTKVKKHEQTITHMQQLLAKKEMETRDKMLRELDKQKKVAQEAVERAAAVERKADLTNSLHQKLLRAEKNKTAAATEEISLLMEKVKDLNNKLVIEGKAQRNPNTEAHFVMNEITKKIKNNTKEKDSGRETMRRQESERTTQGWSKHMRSVKTYTKASVKEEETKKSSSNHLHAAKTYMKPSEKPDETKAIVLGGSEPVDKADSEPTEKTPDESPPSQKPTKLEESQLNNGEQQEHEEKKEKRRKKQDSKRSSPEVEKPKSLGEDQMLSEMTAISREEQMDQRAATGVSRPASSSQCSTEGIAVLSLKSSQRSLNKEVETEAVKMIESLDDHSVQDKLLGQRQGPAGDTQNLLDDPDEQQTNGSLMKTGSASVESPPGLMSDFVDMVVNQPNPGRCPEPSAVTTASPGLSADFTVRLVSRKEVKVHNLLLDVDKAKDHHNFRKNQTSSTSEL